MTLPNAAQVVNEAIAINVDTEGMSNADIEAIEDAIWWALDQAGVL